MTNISAVTSCSASSASGLGMVSIGSSDAPDSSASLIVSEDRIASRFGPRLTRFERHRHRRARRTASEVDLVAEQANERYPEPSFEFEPGGVGHRWVRGQGTRVEAGAVVMDLDFGPPVFDPAAHRDRGP